MNIGELKKIIEESVRKVFNEELKEILLEAVKSPKPIINESFTPTPPPKPTKTLSPKERNEMFAGMLEGMQNGKIATTEEFIPRSVDTINGALPSGEVSLDQIAGLLQK